MRTSYGGEHRTPSTLFGMNDDPLRAIAHHDGVFLYREALDAGYTKAAIAAMRRQGIWHRVRHGAYCFGDVWATLSAEERHVVLARAVARTTPGPIAFSHTTALVLHGIAVWGADLSRVHATRLDEGAYRREVDVVHHVGLCNDNDLSTAQGLPVVRPGRAVIEHASITSTESGLVSADNALFTQMTTPAELRDFNERFTNWPGSQPFHVVLHHMDGRAESVGETRARHLFWRQGLPTPELQWEVHDAGRLIASTDFAWQQHRLFGEFDGRAKYLRPYHDGDDPGDVVFREKQREDLIRRLTGWRFVRFVWPTWHVRSGSQPRFVKRCGTRQPEPRRTPAVPPGTVTFTHELSWVNVTLGFLTWESHPATTAQSPACTGRTTRSSRRSRW